MMAIPDEVTTVQQARNLLDPSVHPIWPTGREWMEAVQVLSAAVDLLREAVVDLYAFVVNELDPDPSDDLYDYLPWEHDKEDQLRKVLNDEA